MSDLSLLKQHNRIVRIGKSIAASETLSGEDREFLSRALIEIGDGDDPKEALNIKVNRGGTPLEKQRKNDARDRLALAWVAAARASVKEGGLGLTLDEAVDLFHNTDAAKIFGINEETLRKYWNNRPDDRGLDFRL